MFILCDFIRFPFDFWCHIWRQCLSRSSGWDRVLQCSLQGRALWYCFSKFLQPNYQCFSWSPFTLSAPTALPICSSCLPFVFPPRPAALTICCTHIDKFLSSSFPVKDPLDRN
ncbi:hypothetical protein GQ55_4G338200 [Panicum hallii var. hallii]|uniref:Uncharacterized protein n=1 Tax=Panicum hallii var. hallii TaxID=1504633 RepID=A0A2T7E343_9POAL|nr:hypothetical protein GQ55_4G338200 [Panicum hallii var. hallii]